MICYVLRLRSMYCYIFNVRNRSTVKKRCNVGRNAKSIIKRLYYGVCSLIEIDSVKINLGFTQFQFHDSTLIIKKQNCPQTELPRVKELFEPYDAPGVRIPSIVTSRSRESMSWSRNEQVCHEKERVFHGDQRVVYPLKWVSRVTQFSFLYILPVLLNGSTSSSQ
jgi:hypothetical protein